MTERPSALDALVDLVVYAPVGLALTAAEELPDLIAKGRAKVEPQLGTARLIGQFVVAEGRRRAFHLGGFGGGGFAGDTAEDRAASKATGGDHRAVSATPTAGAAPARGSTAPRSSAGRPAADRSTTRPESTLTADQLAIPGYDSLSASQVVQRLAGLSPAELAAVGRYETATRGRRTILARIGQLQGA